MKDLKRLLGNKKYIADHYEILPMVRGIFGNRVMCEGSLGSYSYTRDGELVAEAWLHARRSGWWLRIKAVSDAS